MTSFYGSVNGGQGGSGEGIDTSTLMQKNNPTFNGTITGPNARFTGTVQIPEPTEDNHAATKGYVDAALADVDLSEVTTKIDAIETAQDELAAQLDDKVDAENPAFTGTATLNGKNIATVDQIPNISDLPYLDENNPTYTGALTGANATFSGVVSVPTPTQDGQAVNKQYVDQAIAGVQIEVDLSEVQADIVELQTGKLDKANPTYTGSLTGVNAAFSGTVTVATPAAEGEAANKGYVDAAKTELEGDINTLQQTVANQTETINTLNQQVTNITGGTVELPYLKNTGDSGTGVYDFTGATVNAADPVDNSNVATKHYVDQKIASAGGTGEVVSYTQGDGISISLENEISLSIDSAGANGLKVGTNGLGLDLATTTTPGAMAASDKTAIASNTTEITNIKNGTTELPYLKETNPTYEGTLIGGDATFTGSVQVSTPDQDNEAANKSYVDTALAEAKSYTDDAVSGIASDETIQQIQSDIENIKDGTTVLPYLSSAGGTVTGPIKYGTSPKDTSDLANKAYVDAIHVQAVADAKNYTDSEITNLENGTTELPYVKDSGDTVTGTYNFTGANVTIAEPTVSNNPATKNYVDTKIASAGGSGEVVSYTQGNGINISPENIISVVINADNANGLAVDTSGIKLNLATSSTSGAMSGTDKAKLDASSTTEQMNQAINAAKTELEEDIGTIQETITEHGENIASLTQNVSSLTDGTTELPYVKKSGDTMTGSLTTTELFTDFVTIRNAGTDGNTGFQNNRDTDHIRVYDKVTNTLVPIEVGEPVNNQDASTKKYVDDKVTTETAARAEAIESLDEAKADKNNPTFTGIISGADATLSGTLTGNTATFSGGITVPLEPGAEGSAASKKYVDDQIAAIDVSEQIEPLAQRVTTAEGEIDTLQSNIINITNGTTELPYIPSDGGTISGPINWGGNPQEATELANKAYVDANDSDAINSAKEYTNAQIEIAKGYTDEAVTNLTNGTTKLPYVTKEEVEIAADTRDVARAYRYTFNDGLDGTNSNAGFGFIDFTPAIVTEKDGSTSFSPLYIGEPTKDSQATTKKYVDDAIAAVDAPEYTLAKQAAAEDGYFATYYLTKDSVQVGEKINIPKDYLVKEAELLEVAATDTPYSGAVIGDKYIDFTINTQASDEDEQHIYLPVKDLVDVYTGGNGININASNVVSVQIDAANANGLALGSAGLKLNLATTSAAGAMSAADKTKLDTAISEEQLTAVENEVDTLQTEVNNIKSGTTDLGYLKAANPTYTGILNGVNATFTGDVIVPTPDGDTEAANKQYVDSAIDTTETALREDISEVQQSVMQQTGTIDILSQTITGITQGTMALPYVKKAGDTMSGELIVDTTESEELFNGHTIIGGGKASFKDSADANYALNVVGADGPEGYPLIDFSVNEEAHEHIYVQPENTTVLGVTTDDSYANVRLADPVEDDDAATKRYADKAAKNSPAGLSTFTSYPIYTRTGEADYSNASMITTPIVDGPFHSLILYGNTKVDNPQNLIDLDSFGDGYYNSDGSKLTDTNGLSFSFDIVEGVTTYYVSYSGTLKQDISTYSYAITEVMKNGSVFGTRGDSGAVPDTISVLNTGGQPSPTSKIIVSIYGTNFSTVQSIIRNAIAAGGLQIGVDYMISLDHPKEIKSIIGSDTEGVFYCHFNYNDLPSEAADVQEDEDTFVKNYLSSHAKPFTLSTALDGFEGHIMSGDVLTVVPIQESNNGIDYFFNSSEEYTTSCSDKYDYSTGKYTKNIGTFVVNGENAASVLSLGQVPTSTTDGERNPVLGTPRNVIKIAVPNCVSGTLPEDMISVERTRASFASARTGWAEDYQKILSSHFSPLKLAETMNLYINNGSAAVDNVIFYGYTLALTENQNWYYQNSLDGSICFISSSITTIEQATSYFSTHPLTIKYILNEPEEYDIPEEDMTFYKQMDKNMESADYMFIFVGDKTEDGNWEISISNIAADTFGEILGVFEANWKMKCYGRYDIYIDEEIEDTKRIAQMYANEAKERRLERGLLKDDNSFNHSIDSNCLHILEIDKAATTVTLDFIPPSDTDYVYTYHFIFRSGATPTVLTLPEGVIYPDGFEIEANRIYEINIMENLLSYQSWPVE